MNDPNALFKMALQLGGGWKVVRSEFRGGSKGLELWLDFEPGTKFPDPQSGVLCPVHDTRDKQWRHLNFWQYETTLHARVPRILTPEGEVRLVEVPWARAGSGFTLMMEAFAMLLAREMPLSAVADMVKVHDTLVWRIVRHYVEGSPGAAFEGALWATRGNEWTRSDEQLARRRELCAQYPKLGRAIMLREMLQDVLESEDEPSLRWWCWRAAVSRLEPFRKVAASIRSHWDGIVAFLETRITNGAIEGVNGLIQLAKRMARGFRNFANFRAMAYLKAGKLELSVPSL